MVNHPRRKASAPARGQLGHRVRCLKLFYRPRSESTFGLASSTASRLWQFAQSCVIVLPPLAHVVAIVAAEAARIAHVSDVVRMRSPRHLHVGKHILAVERYQLRRRQPSPAPPWWPALRALRSCRRPQAARESWRAPRPGWRRWPSAVPGPLCEPRAGPG